MREQRNRKLTMAPRPLPPRTTTADEWLALVHDQLGGLGRTLHQILDRLPEPAPPSVGGQPVELREPASGAPKPSADTSWIQTTDAPAEIAKEAPAKPGPVKRQARKKAPTK